MATVMNVIITPKGRLSQVEDDEEEEKEEEEKNLNLKGVSITVEIVMNVIITPNGRLVEDDEEEKEEEEEKNLNLKWNLDRVSIGKRGLANTIPISVPVGVTIMSPSHRMGNMDP
nr:hypothetical protein [Tanacetum cinerariifolium]